MKEPVMYGLPLWILSDPRSGSTYFARLLYETKCFPCVPDRFDTSYQHAPFTEFFNIFEDSSFDPGGLKPFWLKMQKHMHNDDGRRCAILSKQELPRTSMVHRIQFLRALRDSDRELIARNLSGLKYIWLDRKDVYARTVSLYLAEELEIFQMSSSQKTPARYKREVPFDETQILKVYRSLHESASKDWSNYLDGLTDGLQYLKVEYPTLVSHPKQVLAEVLEFLNHPVPAGTIDQAIAACNIIRARRPETEEYIAKLRRLLNAKVE